MLKSASARARSSASVTMNSIDREPARARRHCCDLMAASADALDELQSRDAWRGASLLYDPEKQVYGLPLVYADEPLYDPISFCPWCGEMITPVTPTPGDSDPAARNSALTQTAMNLSRCDRRSEQRPPPDSRLQRPGPNPQT
jgi:hypothetical protein